MSKSKGKMKAVPGSAKKKNTSASSKGSGSGGAASEHILMDRDARKNVAKNSTIIFWVTAVVLVLLFVGRWVVAISNGYFGSFVQVDASAATAVGNMKGLNPSQDEKDELLPLQRRWDLFASSRLRDEVTVTAGDGAELHGYLYNEGSDVTVIVLPRFYNDGTSDFLPAVSLHELTGCNLLLPDPRMHGGSGGEYFTYGVRERYDILSWIQWADAALGPQTYILWGEGTGANTALFAAADGILPDSVAFVVAESPYASLHELAKDSIWKWYSVPAFPFLNAIEIKVSASKASFAVKNVDLPAALAGRTPDTPVLFLRSEYDAYILPAWSAAVQEAYAGPSASIAGGASHGMVYAAEQAQIDGLLAQWWAQYGK